MISSLAELLATLRQQETKLLDAQAITHAPTIGSMYEGLTRNLLTKTFPQDFNLRVTSGFIVNDASESSRQIDCMLVRGEGERIPYTDNFRYKVQDVIAVIEVKKNLYSNELDGAYQNLRSVENLTANFTSPFNRLFRSAYRTILNTDPTYVEISKLPVWEHQIGSVLHRESITPVRIVLGYNGFSSERSFRHAFIGYLGRNMLTKGYGPVGLPTLIISGGFSLIKLNGMPYAMRVVDKQKHLYAHYKVPDLSQEAPVKDRLWPLYASYAGNPMILLLELIWTRLTYEDRIFVDSFGSDLTMEGLNALLLAKAIEQNGSIGWYYEHVHMPTEVLENTAPHSQWHPVEINEPQCILLNILISEANKGVDEVDLVASGISVQFEQAGVSLNEALTFLESNALISVHNGKVHLLTDECLIAYLPDDRIVAGDNNSGRLEAWIEDFMNEFRSTTI